MKKEDILLKVTEYIDRLFFYCVKNCNNVIDAEDLSQHILTEVVIQIEKGNMPNNFDYWIWAIVKHQYGRYVNNKVINREYEFLSEDIGEASDNNNTLDDLIQDELFDMINSAIKLLSSDYTKILYRYYVEDMRLQFIADELKLPLGTVKRKLFEIRKRIVEATKMNRLNGKKTYIPENFSFAASGNFKNGISPWDGVSTLIQKNLLHHSYNNPCSLEDYALELGISLPYIEDIVNRLEKLTLLKKTDGKYLTNFVFISVELRNKVVDLLMESKSKIGGLALKLLDDNYQQIIDIGFSGSDIDKNKLYWILLLMIEREVENEISDHKGYTERPCGGKWDFLGYEEIKEAKDIFFVGNNGFSRVDCIGSVWDIKEPHIIERKHSMFLDVEIIDLLYKNPSMTYSKLLSRA